MSTMDPSQLKEVAEHLYAAKIYTLASFVMVFYDIAITFGDEVDKIWKQKFTGLTVLWFMNRYIMPIGYIVVIVAFQDPNWSNSSCRRYVLYPEALKIVATSTVNVIFILRLYAIYSHSRRILGVMVILLLAELSVKIWAFTDGGPVQLPQPLFGCILTGREAPRKRFIYTWVVELIFDSIVFVLTIYKSLSLYRRMTGIAGSLITIILRDGIIYYAAIFAVNLLTVILFIDAADDIKAINASFSNLITPLMVSRLILNLRNAKDVVSTGDLLSTSRMYSRPASVPRQEARTHLQRSIVGNLGNPVGYWGDGSPEECNESSDEEEIELRPQYGNTNRSICVKDDTASSSTLNHGLRTKNIEIIMDVVQESCENM